MEEGRPTVDFVVESPDREVQLLVEAKNVSARSPEWAAQFLRNLSVHATLPHSEYFLLAMRDRFYLWRRPDPLASPSPDFEGDTKQALAPYLSGVRTPLAAISERSFELLVQAWLTDLVTGSVEQPDWVEKSGLRKAIRDGTIRSQLAA